MTSPDKYANVVLPLPGGGSFTYEVPDNLADKLDIGSRVVVPLGRSEKVGVIVEFTDTTDLETVRPISDLADPDPPLPGYVLDLCRWISDYYCCPLWDALSAAHPAGMLAETKRTVRLLDTADEDLLDSEGYSGLAGDIIASLKGKKGVAVNTLRNKFPGKGLLSALVAMEKRGLIDIRESLPKGWMAPKYESMLRINPELTDDYLETWLRENERKSPRQAMAVRYLLGAPPVTRKKMMQETRTAYSTLKSLLKKGLIRERKREIIRDTAWILPEKSKDIVHTENQRSAIDAVLKALKDGGSKPFLLYGVTGSGKTEVYLEVISRCLEMGKTAMVLVPEIALTPQIASRFRARFGGQVVVMHSRISPGERYDSWRRLASGKARVVVGARSALFTPLTNLGLIVVDEEHDPSFKQSNRPHYQARDCAVALAKTLNIPIILGSATPSVESFENARRGKYQMLELPQRVASGKFSAFHLVDLTQDNALIPNTAISPLMMDKIEDRLLHGDKTIILQNRRGFSTFIKCKHCKEVEVCPNCSLTLTYHITNRRLRCHICGFQKRAPSVCSSCGGTELMFCGSGTQKVEEEIQRLFPDARIVRMDLDTTAGIDSHFRILEKFARGEYDILLGTQMVAKGLDFPDVTLVGIISADTELLRPDFRAEERTFRLMVQAAGRSGRHRPGEVVVQTYNPEHRIFNYISNNDYEGFFHYTVRYRSPLRYPPFGRIIAFRLSAPSESAAAEAAVALSGNFDRTGVTVLGPTPALLTKIKRRYYYNLIIKVPPLSAGKLAGIKDRLMEAREQTMAGRRGENLTIEIDVDPVDIF